MKKVRNLLLLLVCAFCINGVYGQTALKIEMQSGSPNGSTMQMGDTFSFLIRIINIDTGTYTGSISLAYKIIDDVDSLTYIGSTGQSDSSGFHFYEGADSIAGGDTTYRLVTGTVIPPRFKAGPSVVVIWPIATHNGFAANELTFSIDVLDPMNISRLDNGRLKVYTSNNNMQIESENEIRLKRVRIFDVMGRLMLDAPYPAGSIPLPVSDHGVYIAEIIYDNNQRHTFRFYR